MSGMTDRDHFAAAALTGLLYPEVDDEFAMPYIVGRAYLWADAMFRERERTNHDAAPERGDALAYDEAAARLLYERDSANDELSLLRRAVRQLLDGVNERHPEKPPREWVCNDMALLDRLVPPNHDAAPEAIASVDSVAPQPTTRGDSDRTDKAAPRPSEGTGDTPDSPKPIKGGVSDRSKPIASEQEPVAWGVADGKGLLATSIHRIDAVDMQSDYAYHTEIVPLYRHPPCQDFSQKNLTLTDAEAETLRELRDEAAQYADEIGLCASEVRGRQRIIDGLLVRLGGGR